MTKKRQVNLYKYRPFDNHLEKIILSQKIWFPKRPFNDPEDLELKLINDVDAGIYQRFLEKAALVEKWAPQRLGDEMAFAFDAFGNLTAQAVQNIKNMQSIMQKILDRLGVCSLSDKENCRHLWDKYGDHEQGVCIAFNLKLSDRLNKVEYKTPRPQLKLSFLIIGDNPESEIRKVLTIKTVEKWKMESEWRYIAQNGNDELSLPGTIEKIRLGKNMCDGNRKKIKEWAAKAKKSIRIEE